MTDGINIEIIAGDATTNGGGDGGDISLIGTGKMKARVIMMV